MKRNGSIVCLSLTSEEERRREKNLLFNNNIRSSIVSPGNYVYREFIEKYLMYEKFKNNKYQNFLAHRLSSCFIGVEVVEFAIRQYGVQSKIIYEPLENT